MTDGTAATLPTLRAAVAATVRAGFSGLSPSVRACWAALIVAMLVSASTQVLPAPIAGLALPIEVAAAIVAWGALYRRAFGHPIGAAGLRWGMDEWRLLASQVLVVVLLFVVLSVLSTVVGAVALGVARASAPGFDATSAEAWKAALSKSGIGTVVAGAAPLISLALLVWLAARLSLAAPATVDQSRIRVLSVFPLTKGVTLQVVAAGVVLAVPVMVLMALSSLVGRWAGPGVNGLLALMGAAFLYLYLAPVWTGALVHIYRHRQTPDGISG